MVNFAVFFLGFCEVRGFWHWVDYLRGLAHGNGREAVFLNFDETSVSQWWLQQKGCVVKKPKWRDGQPPQAQVPANRRRGAITLGAVITHRSDLQPLLPQLVLGNAHVLPKSFCLELEGVASPLLHVWHGKTGWICEATLVKYLSLLADAFNAALPNCQPIIVMDCAPAHLGESVLRLARDRGLYLCYVPAGCTAQIQPLDVAGFFPLKAFLRRQAREALCGKGSFSKMDWFLAINKAATKFLSSRRWSPAFEQCGIIGNREGLRGFLSTMAAKYSEVEPALVAPSPEVIASLLPRNRAVSYDRLLPAQ